MADLLGIDTGGTFTDAVLYDEEKGVLAKAKSLTTHHDLAIGVGGAVGAVLSQSDIAPARIALVSLSTTLATNAMVEGQGGRVGLVYIGFDAADAERPDLKAALNGDPVLLIAGGHDAMGQVRAPLDEAGLVEQARALAPGLTGFAVTGRFAVLDPSHEIAAREILPPWRDLLLVLRRLEARGEVRGGRFVAGFVGEQFALPTAVAGLRALRADPSAKSTAPGAPTPIVAALAPRDPIVFVEQAVTRLPTASVNPPARAAAL